MIVGWWLVVRVVGFVACKQNLVIWRGTFPEVFPGDSQNQEALLSYRGSPTVERKEAGLFALMYVVFLLPVSWTGENSTFDRYQAGTYRFMHALIVIHQTDLDCLASHMRALLIPAHAPVLSCST